MAIVRGAVAADGLANSAVSGPIGSDGDYNALTVANIHYNGASWDRVRTPTTFKGGSFNAAGSSALWTPAAGKKFRLMAWNLIVPGDAAQAVAGEMNMQLLDGGGAITAFTRAFVPGAALAAGQLHNTGWIILANGYLSSAANNVLNVNLGAALTVGNVCVQAIGTEE